MYYRISNKYDTDLDILNDRINLLDNTAAKHKLSIKPKKNHLSNHQRNVSPNPKIEPNSNDKYVFIYIYK